MEFRKRIEELLNEFLETRKDLFLVDLKFSAGDDITVILDGDLTEARKNGAADGKSHPGLLRNSGHIGFLGHGSPVQFRNIRIKDLSKK